MNLRARCPCCKGRKRLTVIEQGGCSRSQCTHCMGEGTVAIEPPRHGDGPEGWPEHLIVLAHSPPGLKRCELSRAVKRDHLLGLRMSSEDATKLLDELYGSEQNEQTPSESRAFMRGPPVG